MCENRGGISPVQLTVSGIGKHIRLALDVLKIMTVHIRKLKTQTFDARHLLLRESIPLSVKSQLPRGCSTSNPLKARAFDVSRRPTHLTYEVLTSTHSSPGQLEAT